MRKLILTDGEVNNGGYSTLAFNVYKNMKEKYDVKFYTFILTDKLEYGINEIKISEPNNDESIFNKLNSFFCKRYFDMIICTSPWAFYLASLYFNKSKICYIKGGGLKTDKYITNLSNTYILDTNVDNYFDSLTIKLERKSIMNNKDYTILPTTDLLYEIMIKSSKYMFAKDKILKPLNFAWFDIYDNIADNLMEKEYDLIFVVSDHKRIVKNSSFAYTIFETNPNLTKIVIGINCEHYNILPNTTVINKHLENSEVKQIFRKSRILLVPSYYDSGPSTVVEAALQNCISICYHNCGFSSLDIGCVSMKNLDIQKWNYTIKNKLMNSCNTTIHNSQDIIKNNVKNNITLFVNIISD